MVSIDWLRSLFVAQITVGDLLAVLVPLVASISFLLHGRWKARHPFVLKLARQPFDLPPDAQRQRTFAPAYRCPVGQHQILVMATTRRETVSTPFNMRFVERNWRRWGCWQNAARTDIEITEVTVPEWNQAAADLERDFIGPNRVETQADGVGGFTVTTRKPKAWVVGQPLWIVLSIDTKCPWQGALSFEGRTDRRAFARLSVTVVDHRA